MQEQVSLLLQKPSPTTHAPSDKPADRQREIKPRSSSPAAVSVVTSSDSNASEHAGSNKAAGSDDQPPDQPGSPVSAQTEAPINSPSLLDSLPRVDTSRVSSPEQEVELPGGTPATLQEKSSSAQRESSLAAESSEQQAHHPEPPQQDAGTQPDSASGPISIAALMLQAQQQQQQDASQPQQQQDQQLPQADPGIKPLRAAEPSSSACTTNDSIAVSSEHALRLSPAL